MALIATPCDPKANSYVTYEELEDRLSLFDWWEALTPLRKENAAKLAAATLDSVPFIGRKLIVGQRMQIPRDTHQVIKLDYVKLKNEEGYEGILVDIDAPTTSVSGYLDVFPLSATFYYKIGGVEYSATMNDDGSVIGEHVVDGSVTKETGYVSLKFDQQLDVPSSIRYKADGKSRYIIKDELLEYDPSRFHDDVLKHGSVKLISNVAQYLIGIESHNIITGEIKLEAPINLLDDYSCLVINPINEDVKMAQYIQTTYVITKSGTFPMEGIRFIKIGNTMVSFSDRLSAASKYARLASRYGLHPAAFVLILPYTIYGSGIDLVRG